MLKRVLSAVGIAALLVGAFAWCRESRVIFVSLLALIASYEMLGVLKQAGFAPVKWPVYSVVILFTVHLLFKAPLQAHVSTGLFIFIGAALHRLIIKESTVKSIFAGLCAVIYPAAPTLLISAFASFPLEQYGAVLFAGIIASACNDIFALLCGMAFGKHKLTELSPKKTVEGLIGGLVAGTLSGLAVYFMCRSGLCPAVSLWRCLAAAAGASGAGVVGDLVASAVKREASVKDFGTILPGHGGILDRIDSALFAVPMAFIVLCIL